MSKGIRKFIFGGLPHTELDVSHKINGKAYIFTAIYEPLLGDYYYKARHSTDEEAARYAKLLDTHTAFYWWGEGRYLIENWDRKSRRDEYASKKFGRPVETRVVDDEIQGPVLEVLYNDSWIKCGSLLAYQIWNIFQTICEAYGELEAKYNANIFDLRDDAAPVLGGF